MINKAILEGFEVYDYVNDAVEQKATVESVFELFNGVVSAVERESNSRTVLCRVHDGDVPFVEKRQLELVSDYDEFINSPNFELDCFSVGKMDMENFWASVGRRNAVNIGNKAVTYGKSTIYVVRRNKAVIGFLLNNMTYDGQNMFFLTSVKLGSNARALFKGTKNYPRRNSYRNVRDEETGKIEKAPSRWTRINNYLESVGATTVSAWEFLESDDSKFFYGELKKHNYLSNSDKQLLKSIYRMDRVASFDVRIENIESRIDELEDLIVEYEANKDTETSVFEYFDAKDELDELEHELVYLSEEHNSESPVTLLEDYAW